MKFCNCRRILDIYSQGLLRTRINLSVLSGSNWNLSVGFWRERKTGAPREKPLGKAEKQQQTYPFIYLKHEKGRSLPIKAIIGSTPPPREKEGKCPYYCSTLAQFSSDADLLVVFVLLVVSTQKCK